MIYRALSRVWLLLGLSLLLLALLISVVRFGIPQLQAQRQALLDWVWSAPGLDSRVERLSAGWTRDGPTLRLKGLQLIQRSGPQTWTLAVTEARLHLDLWQSLRQRQWVLGELQFQGLQLALPADWLTPPTGDDKPATDWQPLVRLFLGSLRDFEISDSQISVRSRLGEISRLQIERLRWRNQGNRHQGEGIASLSHQAVSNSLRLVIDLQGPAARPERLEGQLYLASQEQQDEALAALIQGAPSSLRGQLGFELWLERRQQAWQLALLRLGDNRLSWQEGKQPHSVEVSGGQLQWLRQTNGWQLATHDLKVRRDQAPWRDWAAQLDQRDGRLSGRMDTVELGELAPMLSMLVPADTRWGEALRTLAPRGQLRELSFSRAPDSDAWQLTGQLTELALERWQMIPQLRGLNGHFSLGADSGQLALSLGKGVLDFGPYFPKPLRVNALTAGLGWQRTGEDWQLDGQVRNLATPDLDARTSFRLALAPEQSPRLDLYAEVDLHDAAEAYRYFPRLAMGQGLTDYLTRALQGGSAQQAKILWHGAFADFPYRHGEGVFQAWVPLRQSRFQFDPGWQPLSDMSLDLLFENDRLDMVSDGAHLGAASAPAIHAYFPSLAPGAHLYIDADVAGDGQAVSDYLIASPLRPSVGAALTAIKVEDPLTGDLKLDIPLDGSAVKVNGHVNFPDNRVTVQALNLPLTKVQGQLYFDEGLTRFDKLQAELWQQPLTLDYQGQKRGEDYAIDIGLSGRWQSQRAGNLPAVVQKSFDGQARWGGKLALALKPGGKYDYQAGLQSDLKGLALALPAPYAKAAGTAWPLRLDLTGNETTSLLQGSLDKQLQLEAELLPQQGRFSRFWLMTPQQPRPESPLAVDLRLDRADAGGWLAWLTALQQSGGAAGLDSAGSLMPAPMRLQARVGQLQLAGQTWHQANLDFAPADDGQTLTFQSQETRGYLSLPASAEQPKLLHFDRLALRPGTLPHEPLSQDEQKRWLKQLPWLKVDCLDCRYGDYELGQLSGELKPEQAGARIRDLRWQLANAEFKGEASWLLEGEQSYSRLKGQLHAPSSEALVRKLGFEPGILGTPADLSLELGWPGALHQPDLSRLQGQFRFKTEQGVLREVNSPGARLLSLLSLGSIVKRLSLDFRDLFSEGLFFDGMSMSGQIKDGLVRSEDFLLQSGAGDMRGHGTVDLPRWQLDYRFNFVPRLSSGLSVATAFALTPITGVYVLALSKLLEPVIDVITQVNYQVKGDIDHPQITETGREQGRLPLSHEELKAPR